MINIYDLTGRLIESHDFADYDVKVGQGLPAGIFFAKISLNGEVTQVIKLLKNF